ncbi:MAG: SUMF1/EgtB/PvdO family nonheme iron enzyme [Chloroflexota bacterium]
MIEGINEAVEPEFPPNRSEEISIVPIVLEVPANLPGFPDNEWIKIPAGSFHFGGVQGDSRAATEGDETYNNPIFNIPYDYWISKFEVTNGQYKLFLDDTDLENLPQIDDHSCTIWNMDGGYNLAYESHPVVCVTWYSAAAYAEWLNSQLGAENMVVMLPSEPEWEKAARGAQDNRIYPWGRDFDGSKLNCGSSDCPNDGHEKTAPVGSFQGGASPFGVEDMAGNAWEWTRNKYVNSDYYDPNDGREALTGQGTRVARGGSWYSPRTDVRISNRSRTNPEGWRNYTGNDDLGFRVVILLASR